MPLKGLYVIRQNIEELLRQKSLTQTDLAEWVGKKKSWINKFLGGTRQLQLKDLDRIADILGVATYQLFQPGISRTTERRVFERRKRTDRRISQRVPREADLDTAHERHPIPRPDLEPITRALNELQAQLAILATDARDDRQATGARPRKAKAR